MNIYCFSLLVWARVAATDEHDAHGGTRVELQGAGGEVAAGNTLEEIHDRFAPAVAKRTSEILSEVTNGKYASVSIKGGKLVVRDKDKNIIGFEKLSSTACNIVYFSLRLAVAEITSGNMNYPVILNDYYLRVSESKVAELLKFLKEYSAKNQVIIFSPTNRISSVALNEQINIDDVNLSSLT